MNYLKYLVEEIHTTVMATVDNNGLPVTCAIDIMDYDDTGLYFLTAKGKNLYERLKQKGYVALTGMKGSDTLSCVAVSVSGKAQEIGSEPLEKLFEKNSYTKSYVSLLISDNSIVLSHINSMWRFSLSAITAAFSNCLSLISAEVTSAPSKANAKAA